MRIAVVSHRALHINGNGGLERAATEIAEALAARGVEVELVTSVPPASMPPPALDRFPFAVTLLPPPLRRGVSGWLDYRVWTAAVARHLPTVHADFVVSFYGDLHRVKDCPPSLVFPFGLEWLVTPGFRGLGLRVLYGPMLRRGIQRATYLGTSGAWHTGRTLALVPTQAKPVIVHNWKLPETEPLASRVEARRALGLPEDAALLGVVSRLAADKRLHVAIEGVRELRKTHPRLRFVIAGDGRERANLEVAAGGDEGITFLGRVDDATARLLIRASDATINVARTEYQLFQVIEALAVGTPVLSTYAERQEGLVAHGDTGYALSAPSVIAVIEGLRRMLSLDATSRERVDEACRAAVAQGYTVEDAATTIVRLAEAAVAQARR